MTPVIDEEGRTIPTPDDLSMAESGPEGIPDDFEFGDKEDEDDD